eukprot:12886690-Prorocentrum_lima.AAC.1
MTFQRHWPWMVCPEVVDFPVPAKHRRLNDIIDELWSGIQASGLEYGKEKKRLLGIAKAAEEAKDV